MIRATLKFTKHSCFFVLHLVAGALLLAIVLIGTVMWKFSQGPIDLTFAANYVREALEDPERQVTVKFASIEASWPNLEGSPDIRLKSFSISEKGRPKVFVREIGLQFAILPLLIGKVQPETIALKSPVIRIIRQKDGNFHLLVADQSEQDQEEVTTVPAEPVPPPTVREIGEALFIGGPVPDQALRMFSSLRSVNITAAKLIAEDRILNTIWTIPEINVYLNRSEDSIDLSTNYQPPDRSEMAALSARISKTNDGYTYSADIQNSDIMRLARVFSNLSVLKGHHMMVNGIVEGRLDQDWMLDSAIVAVRSPSGTFRFNPDHEDEFAYKALSINMVYDKKENRFSIANTNLKLNDTTLSISAEREVGMDGRAIIPVRVSVPQITLMQIASLWPKQFQDSNAADWLIRRLGGATLRNLAVTIRIPEADPASLEGKDVDAVFDYEGLSVDYRAPLTPATEAKGQVTLKDDVLDIEVESGRIGDLVVRGGRVTITDLTADMSKIGTVTVLADLNGSLASVLNYISKEPISLGETIGVDVAKVAGQGSYDVEVTFPALQDLLAEQVKVKVDAKLNDIRLPGIVHGLDLSGGPFALKVEGGAFTISGKGQLDGAPIDLTYSEYIEPERAPYASDIRAKVDTTLKIREALGVNVSQFITGTLPVDIHYKEPKKGDVLIEAKADLTPARGAIQPMGFVKPEGAPGTLSCEVVLKNGQPQQIRNLEVSAGDGMATGGRLDFGMVGKSWDVKTGAFNRVTLGGDNDFAMTFTQSAPNVLAFKINGKKLDGRPFLKPAPAGAAASSNPSVALEAKVDQMRTGDDTEQVITTPVLNVNVTTSGDVRFLELAAKAGTGTLRATLNPNAQGVMGLSVKADDAGGTLRAFDVYDTMIGGSLIIDGEQIKGGNINDIKGSATIRDFAVVKAPVLAQLMNGLSLSGADELLRNKGISFSKLRTDYTWKRTKEGRVISFTNGRTAGASIGLTFGGIVQQSKGTLDISGTFVPMSEINKVVSSIPVIGALLTGGKDGGIIAATYAMKGPSENPRVFVNPLSVLTPGFLRSILFEGGISDADDDDPAPAPAPGPKKKQFN